jgi:hypothetical protein
VKIKKRDIISRLVNIPSKSKRIFWQKEMTLLNRLEKKFDSLDFWSKVELPHKLDSLAVLFSDYYASLLKKKFIEFNYEIPTSSESVELSDSKFGESLDLKVSSSNIKNFLS